MVDSNKLHICIVTQLSHMLILVLATPLDKGKSGSQGKKTEVKESESAYCRSHGQ